MGFWSALVPAYPHLSCTERRRIWLASRADKWSPVYADNLPPLLNIGQGSPTSVFSGQTAHFPEKYRRSMYAFDWSFGIIYAFLPQADGATYKATAEEFVSG